MRLALSPVEQQLVRLVMAQREHEHAEADAKAARLLQPICDAHYIKAGERFTFERDPNAPSNGYALIVDRADMDDGSEPGRPAPPKRETLPPCGCGAPCDCYK